ncbi:MAG TPA: CpsD/CapB family tyrosine-protein kinase [Terriglobia bacterium]|nr:CpsD/CapB family tyrosine-protein kinase [Terriglobia bacterium]
MSRIHEALKKAQLERGAGQGPAEPDLGAVGEPGPPPPAMIEDSALVASGGIATAAFEPLTLESIRQQCPVSDWKPDAKAVLFADPASSARPSGAEEFRTLRSRLYHLREKRPLQSVLVTSALPSEGKTFVTLNLARAIAQQPHRSVLVIDADLRIARIHEGLGASPTPGLSDYLRGEADLISILQRGPEDNFFIIPGGSSNANPSEFLGTGRLRTLLNRVTPAFDWILLDSPPCVFLSDASLIAKVCDGVLIVVQSGLTPFDTARKARREFPEEQLVGVVLNRVPAGLTYGAYYYYGSGYGYGYGRKAAEPKNGKS